jgi:hypothetical protein
MKNSISYIIILLIISCFSTVIYGQSTVFEEPVLLTSAGQSADVTITKILLTRAGVTFNLVELAEAKDLENVKTLIIVAGGSSKGLGAANIDKDKELERIGNLIEKAKKDNIKILTMHIGGATRRGKLSDPFCEASGNAANFLIVVNTGNEDGLFTKIAETNKIEIREIKNSPEAIPVLQEIFEKK